MGFAIFWKLFFYRAPPDNFFWIFSFISLFFPPIDLIETIFPLFFTMFYHRFQMCWMNIMNLNSTVVSVCRDITSNLAVFCLVINIYTSYTSWISVLHCYLNVRLNLKWNFRKQSPWGVLYKRCSQIFVKTLRKTTVVEFVEKRLMSFQLFSESF